MTAVDFGVATITATIETFSATSTVSVVSALTLSPPSVERLPNGTQQFTVIAGGKGPFTWTVNGVVGGNATYGTISTAGFYNAPSAVPQPASFDVCATQSVPDQYVFFFFALVQFVLAWYGLCRTDVERRRRRNRRGRDVGADSRDGTECRVATDNAVHGPGERTAAAEVTAKVCVPFGRRSALDGVSTSGDTTATAVVAVKFSIVAVIVATP